MVSNFFLSTAVCILILAPALVALCYLSSQTSSWLELAAKYRTTVSPQGKQFRTVSAQIGGQYYRNSLTIHTSPQGLRIATWLIPLPFHPPLLIPWTEIEATFNQHFSGLYAVLEVGNPVITTIRIHPSYLEPYIILPTPPTTNV